MILTLHKLYDSRRVACFVMRAVLVASSAIFHVLFTLERALKRLHPGLQVLMRLLMHSRTSFGLISKGTRKPKKRLKLDVSCAVESFWNIYTSCFAFIRSSYDLADEST